MQSIVLVVILIITIIFGFFAARALGHFLDENQISGEQETEMGFSVDDVEKQDAK